MPALSDAVLNYDLYSYVYKEKIKITDKKKIVVADDDLSILSALRDTLDYDYNVYTATNGILAISKVERVRPDLVILDVNVISVIYILFIICSLYYQ